MLNEGQVAEELNLNDKDIFIFHKGIPGFEEYTKFVFYKHDEQFSLLQSVENEQLAFIVTNPFIFFKDYEFELQTSEREELLIEGLDEVDIISIVTWGEEPAMVTTNLVAPIVLNINKRLGKQVVLNNSHYTTKHPLKKNEAKDGGSRASVEP